MEFSNQIGKKYSILFHSSHTGIAHLIESRVKELKMQDSIPGKGENTNITIVIQ